MTQPHTTDTIHLRTQYHRYYEEYRVAVYVNGEFDDNPTAYCDDCKEDALHTMDDMAARYAMRGHAVTTSRSIRRYSEWPEDK